MIYTSISNSWTNPMSFLGVNLGLLVWSEKYVPISLQTLVVHVKATCMRLTCYKWPWPCELLDE